MSKLTYVLVLFFLLPNLFVKVAFADVVEVDLVIENHKFEPNILELPAGKKIRITVHNNDSTIEEFESIDLKREKIILGKSKARIVLAPLKPGEYKFFGEFHEDTAQGIIVVKEKLEEQNSNND
jgi:plastocyanin